MHPADAFTVLIPVGPSRREVDRLLDVLDSLRTFEPADHIRLILVDDSPTPRTFSEITWPTETTIVRTPLWSHRRPPDLKSALVAGAMAGIREAATSPTGFCLKMDTDALVVAPFADKVRAAFAADPDLGMVGSYDRTCTGDVRDVAAKARVIAGADRPVHVWRRRSRFRVPTGVWYKRPRHRAAIRRLRSAAERNGYQHGAHCLGGAYALSPAYLAHADLLDFRPWIRTPDLGEDVSVSLVCRAAGLGIRGMVDRDDPFGMAYLGLPADPDWLVRNGHSLVHSLKDGRGRREADVRQRFADLRELG